MGKLLPVAVLLVLIATALGADRGPSTPDERTRLLKAAEVLQKRPLSPEARKEGAWALQFITDVPDINVTVCGSFSPDYKYEGQVMASDVVSMGAFIVKNPTKAKDQNAVWRAGIDGLLTTYESILDKDRAARDDFYDDLEQQRKDDDLATFMREFGLKCLASGSRTRT